MSLLRFFGFGGSEAATVPQITVQDAYARMGKGTLILVDVRRPEEWRATGRPKGSHGVTLQDPDFVDQIAAIVTGDKTRAVALSCRSGTRSSKGAGILAKEGFTDVSSVAGGFLEWQKQGLPTDRYPFVG